MELSTPIYGRETGKDGKNMEVTPQNEVKLKIEYRYQSVLRILKNVQPVVTGKEIQSLGKTIKV